MLECRVLKLMLQPIVENALMHGLGAAASGGFVLIRVYGEEGDLKIEVMDNGRGMTREQIDALLGKKGEIPSRFSGMGVRNVHERIARMYGEPYGVKLYSEEGLYTKVEIRFPRIWSSETRAEEVG